MAEEASPTYSRPGALVDTEPSDDGELITPSYTRDEWEAVFRDYLREKRCILFGHARPNARPEEQAETAEWLAGVVMDAAGELLGD